MNRVVTTLLSTLAFSLALGAQSVPATLNYQGRLTDNTPQQNPLTATLSMSFELWDCAACAASADRLWLEPASGTVPIVVTNGIFNVQLGGNGVPVPAAVFSGGSQRWLQVIVNGEALTPRQQLTATGYADQAENANAAASAVTATTAANSTQLGGVAANGYLLTTGTAADSGNLGGSPAASYQKRTAAGAFTCTGAQLLQAVAADGAPSCVTPSVTETDPKVGALATGRIPRWNGTSLADGSLFDTGTNVAIGTTTPITQFQVAGRLTQAGSTYIGLSFPYAVYVQGRYAFVASSVNNALAVFDISNPANPVNVGSSSTGLNAPRSVYVQGRYAFVGNVGNNALVIFDISNPASPVNIGSTTAGLLYPNSIYVQGRYAFVASANNNALVVFDVSNPASPVKVGSSSAGLSVPQSVYVQGRYAFVASNTNHSLVIFDIANPASPVNVGSSTAGLSNPLSVSVQGRYAYVTSSNNNALVIFDISNPASPVKVGSSTSGLNTPYAIYVQGRYAFVTNYFNNALVIFDIGDPASPVNVASSSSGLSSPFSVFVQGRYAFVASDTNHSLVTFDLGGAYVQQLEAGGIETGTLATRANAQINGDAQIKGGLAVGNGGVFSDGPLTSPQWQALTPLPNAAGALGAGGRVSAPFTTHGGRLQIFASATASAATAASLLKVDLYLDGALQGSLFLYANAAGTHQALGSLQLVLTGIAPGSHTVALKNGNGATVTDDSDYSEVAVTELPF